MRLLVTFLMAAAACLAADKATVAELLRLHHARSPQFQEALVATLDAANIRKGTAIIGEGPDFFWAVEADKQPTLYVDDSPGVAMTRLNGNLWYRTGQLQPGTAHAFYYTIGSERFGGRTDIPAFGPDSYEKPGVPRGKVTGKLVHTSKIYEGMQSDYWVYTPAAYDASKPAALMVWQDGHNLADRDRSRAQIVFDNLTAAKKIPVMVHVFIDPGKIGQKAMRSIEYDTMDDRYARFLRDEILAEVAQKYSLRKDAYSRGISGSSSGGICSFKCGMAASPINSAAYCRGSAATPAFNGIRPRLTAATCSRSRSANSRSAISGSGCRTARRTWKTIMEAGRCRISRWPIPSRCADTTFT